MRCGAAAFAAAVLVLLPPAARAEPLCASNPFDSAPRLAGLVAMLKPAFDGFPSLRGTLLRDVKELCLSDEMLGVRGYVEPQDKRIVIAADMTPGLMQAVMVHELRHMQQQRYGACPAPGLSMRENARAIFAMEADASVTTLLVAGSLKVSGEAAMWDALTNWPMQADIAAAFAQQMEMSNSPSAAASAAFSQWYNLPERKDAYYSAACSDYLDRVDRTHVLPSYERLPPGFFDTLCTFPNGTRYTCVDDR